MKRKHYSLENALENIFIPAHKSDLPVKAPSDNPNEFLSTCNQLFEETASLENSSTNMSIWMSQIDESIEQDANFDDRQDDDIEDIFEDTNLSIF